MPPKKVFKSLATTSNSSTPSTPVKNSESTTNTTIVTPKAPSSDIRNRLKNKLKEKHDALITLDNKQEEEEPTKEMTNDDEKNINISSDSSVIDTTTSFEALGLDSTICQTLKEIGYNHPTKIQKEVIPCALSNKIEDKETGFVKYNDIIGISETGSGKTAAYILPILQRLLMLKSKPSPCSALILAPTRELALQIQNHVNAIGSRIGITSTCLIGGNNSNIANDNLRFKKNQYHIVVGTPGRICDLLEYGKSNFNLHHTKFLVLDEADKMLGSEFDHWLTVISQRMRRKQCTVYLFSATMTKKIEKLLKLNQMTDPVKIQVTSSKYHTVDTLKQTYLLMPEKYKEQYLVYLLNENPGKRIVIFAGQNAQVILLSILLRSLNFPAVPLAGHMADGDRQHCLRRFVSGDRPILVATDIAARGLDIPLVEIVINYDIPAHSKEYVHRVGRTARIGNEGLAITFVTQYDLEYFQKIEQLIEKKMDKYDVEKDNVLLLTNTVSQALKLAKKKIVDMENGEIVNSDVFKEEEQVLNSAIKSLTEKRAKNQKVEKKKKRKQQQK
ncbi:hypothetical protein ABK040_001120 [Willaertia magna]